MSKHKIQLAIFDWAGTTIDFGSRAPALAFQQLFAAQGVNVTPAEARAPMGLPKRDHLVAMLRNAAIAGRWQKTMGRAWTDADVQRLYDTFMPYQLETIATNCTLVPDVLKMAAWLAQHKIRVGATTGYFRTAANMVQEAAARQGFAPEFSACVDDVHQGRPAPWMIFRVMERLNVYPPCTVVKVGDTIPDIDEGRSAGVWSVGVTYSSSEVGLSEAELAQLPLEERRELSQRARTKFFDAGAHGVIETLSGLPDLINELNQRLQHGEKP